MSMLDEIIARPDDMGVRRMYAQSILGSDPVRSELIDTQLDIREALRRGQPADPTKGREAVAKHGAAWAGQVAKLVDRYAFWGGFVEEVVVSASAMANLAAAAKQAPIRHVRVLNLGGKAPQIPAEVIGLVGLDVGEQQLGDAAVAAIAAAPWAQRLRYLRIAGNPCGVVGVKTLAGLKELRFVDATETNAPLVVRSEDWDGSNARVDFTAVREKLVGELGHLPWLDAQDAPTLDTI